LAISLGTPNPARARLMAAELNLVAEKLSGRLAMMTTEQIKGVFRQVLLKQVAKADAVIAGEMGDPTFDPRESIQEDMRRHWTYRWLAMRGPNAEIDDDLANQMRVAKVSEQDIYTIAIRLQQLRHAKMVPTPEAKLEALLTDVGADPTEVNIRLAQQTYFRAISEAAALSARAQQEGRAADRAEAEAVMLAAARETVDAAAPTGERQGRVVPMAKDPAAPMASAAASRPQPITACSFEEHPVYLASEQFITAKNRSWKDKGKAARSNFRLLVLRLLELQIYRIEDLKQTHFAAYKDLLAQLAQSYGKAEADHTRSLAELRAIGAQKPSHLRGLGPTTVNKHLTKLNGLLRFMRARGHEFPPIDLKDLREETTVRGRDLTQAATPRAQKLLFELPVFNGCAGPEELFEAGTEIFHCAAYFVPLLLKYLGARREEMCSLMVEDVVFDDGSLPYIDIRENQYRTLKTLASPRALPIPSEVLRLNFRLYWEVIRGLGHDLLFPELYWGDSSMPLGDRFGKNFQQGLDIIRLIEVKLEFEAEDERKKKGKKQPKPNQPFRFRQLRKALNDDLKQAGVRTEFRADIMGHAQKTVNEERYTSPTKIKFMRDLLVPHIEVITGILPPRPIQLLPWVRDNLPPPDARGRARKLSLVRG
jgi:integrase